MDPVIEQLIGLILMVVLGPAVGNYATSVVYRLPRGQTPFEKHPYCGNCDRFLQPEDLFPIWSYLLLRGKCRYCEVSIPPIYTFVEVACGVLFVVHYLLYGISEEFVLLTALGVFLITLVALEYQQGRLFSLILTYLACLAALWRVLQDGSIYPFFMTGVTVLVAVVALWRALAWIGKASATQAPAWVWLATLLGMMMPLKEAGVAVLIMLLLGLIMQRVLHRPLWSAAAMGVMFSWLWLVP